MRGTRIAAHSVTARSPSTRNCSPAYGVRSRAGPRSSARRSSAMARARSGWWDTDSARPITSRRGRRRSRRGDLLRA